MKAALFCPIRYNGPAGPPGWPVPGDVYSPEVAQKSMQASMALFKRADEVGFDWVTVAEHHYSPFSLSPNPMVIGGAMTQVIKNAKIALLGATIPILNPIRVAEEFAMLDTMSGGRLIAGMLRGSPNEYVTYNINPSESRGRFEEALQLIKMAWTETEPFGWQGRYYEYKSVSIWPRPVQQPHPKIYMSGSSPESSEFAARNRIGLGLAFTNVPQAMESVAELSRTCQARRMDADSRRYHLSGHLPRRRHGRSGAGRVLDRRQKCATGKPHVCQSRSRKGRRQRRLLWPRSRCATQSLMPRPLQDSIDLGQIILGGPDTVVKQIERIHRDLGAGILDLTIANDLGEITMHAVDLIGTKVMPRVRHLQ